MKSKNLSAVLLIALLSFVAPIGCTDHIISTDSDTDTCPDDPNKIEPGFCGCGIPDIDTDGDTTLNCSDACSNDPNKAKPGFCGCGTPDTDSDSDGTPDCKDTCPDDPNKTEPGLCGCGTPDTDTDGDTTPDCNDTCPEHSIKIKPGICGCSTPDTDTDGDTTLDCNDACPDDTNKTEPGFCGCGTPDTDSDGDTTPDCNDKCAEDPDKTEPGLCGCGTPDNDTDTDSDGTPDCIDKCPSDPTKTEPGICGCDIPDDDTDTDSDGTPDCIDKCSSDPQKQHCPCHLSGRNAEVEITEDGETKRVPVCMEEGGVLQVGYTGKDFSANSVETLMQAFAERSISLQNIRLTYAPAGNLLTNPTLESDSTGWSLNYNISRSYEPSFGENCTYQSTPCLCRAFGQYPALITRYIWTHIKQTIQLSNTACGDATTCILPLTVGMFAYAINNNNKPKDKIQISFMEDSLEEDVVHTETKFFTMTKQVQLSETLQDVELTFAGIDSGNWNGHYGAALQYLAAWLGDREIRFSNDGTTWTPWQTFAPAEKGSSDAWFVEWDIGKCDADETSCTKTVYMQTHDLLTNRYYETSDSVQYIPTM